jgi:hypothetical protein
MRNEQPVVPRTWIRVAAAGLAALAIACPRVARAETHREYVNRYVMLLDWIERTDVWVSTHLEDPGLARMAHSIAEREVELAERMTPPPEFVAIHPHVLLLVENAERMIDTAAQGNRIAYRRHQKIVHDEQRLLNELLQGQGVYMPTIGP